ncbi:helix-turn-helix transcriptional regulator [Flammeovirga agarivorans]|uniref:Helix-turn-helix domain-containing protein n=1 Tax=Flammeovirga agarivorans TaxID=2726742 RepID=A0A7X8XV28_9BACT|nr:helix-turn-helix transcriptional regulator [Flammeovirga agarivorans]NLR90918.1 helix-turn-helix domain-containing protein [Flammeovirga agarivorans]
MSNNLKLNHQHFDNQLKRIQDTIGGTLLNENHLAVDNDNVTGNFYYHTNGYMDFVINDLKVNQDITIEFFHRNDKDFTAQFFGNNLQYQISETESIEISIPNGLFIFKDTQSIDMNFKKGDIVQQATIYFSKDILRTETIEYLKQLDNFIFHEGDSNLLMWKKSIYDTVVIDQDLKEEWYVLKMTELNLLFQNLIRRINAKEEKKIYTDYELDCVFKIKDIITTDIKSKPVVSELAQEYGINLNKLEKVFKHLFKETVYQFYKKARIYKVQDEIKSTNKAFTEIAYDYGYTDVNHMSKNFKKTFGITPSQYKSEG